MHTDLISVGKIVATFGVDGEVVLIHKLGKQTKFKQDDVLFIGSKNQKPIPYFIKNCTGKSMDECLISFSEISTKEKAKIIIGKEVWINSNLFEKYVSKKAPMALLQFAIYNDGKEIGLVADVIEQEHQIILVSILNEKEILIPVNESTLIKIDYKQKQIFLQLPDGLLEIYS